MGCTGPCQKIVLPIIWHSFGFVRLNKLEKLFNLKARNKDLQAILRMKETSYKVNISIFIVIVQTSPNLFKCI